MSSYNVLIAGIRWHSSYRFTTHHSSTFTLFKIYCPLDSPESAFHRCLYLFGCRKSECLRNGRSQQHFSSPHLSIDSILCLRSQLPQVNEFYPLNPTESEVDYVNMYVTYSDGTPLCAVCG
jgi:hypothetical protein